MSELCFTREAAKIMEDLKGPEYAVKLKKVRKTLGLLQVNPRHPGLNSHKYSSLKAPDGSDVWESYVENHTPRAWRVFWQYGPDSRQITILTIGPHPD